MKIFLTGYSGFLGRHLAKAFVDHGCSIRALLHRHSVSLRDLDGNIEVAWGSIDNPSVIRDALIGMDAVVHSAWSFSAPGDDRPTINERAASIFIEESVEAGIEKFAFMSSVAVYGMERRDGLKIREDHAGARGKEERFIYPSEKISVEEMLLSHDRKGMLLGIFRPGQIMDEKKGPAKKTLAIGPWNLGLGIGDGRNLMAYIHAQDVADAVQRWLLEGREDGIFNVVPSEMLSARQWLRLWGLHNGMDIRPVFLPAGVFSLGYLGIGLMKKLLGRRSTSDVDYAIACATRNLCYSNEHLKSTLQWSDTVTMNMARHGL